jgi:rhamnosyl/mannosyltransferase
MKVLHVGKFYPPENGGIESVTYECVEGLKALGHEVDVICATDSAALAGDSGKPGSRIFRCRSFGTYLRSSVSPRYVAQLRRICREYDVISIHLPNPLPMLSMLGMSELPPLMLHWHADVSTYGLAYRAYSFLERSLLKRCHSIVVATDAHFATSPVLADFRDKVVTIPYGISVSSLHAVSTDRNDLLASLAGRKIIFSLGRFVPYKGFDSLIRAAAVLPDDYVVIIGGTGPLWNECRALVDELGLADKVKLPGRISDESLGAYYRACHVFCLPSVTTAEAFGVVMIEAMSFGKPVVATRLGNGVEWVAGDGNTGLTVPVSDSAALADALQMLLNDKDRYDSYSKNAVNRFDHEFTCSVMASRLTTLYQTAVNGEASPHG